MTIRKDARAVLVADIGDGKDDQADAVFFEEGGNIKGGADDLVAQAAGAVLAGIIVNNANDTKKVLKFAAGEEPDGQFAQFTGTDDENAFTEAHTRAAEDEPAIGKAGEQAFAETYGNQAEEGDEPHEEDHAEGDPGSGEPEAIGKPDEDAGEGDGKAEIKDVGGAGAGPFNAMETEEGVEKTDEDGDDERYENEGADAEIDGGADAPDDAGETNT